MNCTRTVAAAAKNKFISISTAIVLMSSLASFNAQANLLTAGDFEGISSIDTFWASSTDVWGAENSVLTGATGGVTPFGTQMLQINHAGGGSVSQVHQMVAGPFVTGTTVTFDVQLNSIGTGVAAQLMIAGRNSISTGDLNLVLSSTFILDSSVSTWQSFSLTSVLTADFNFLSAEIRYLHSTLGGGNVGFADNAVLTAVAPATVPAPPTVLLLGSGLLGLVSAARRKRKV